MMYQCSPGIGAEPCSRRAIGMECPGARPCVRTAYCRSNYEPLFFGRRNDQLPRPSVHTRHGASWQHQHHEQHGNAQLLPASLPAAPPKSKPEISLHHRRQAPRSSMSPGPMPPAALPTAAEVLAAEAHSSLVEAQGPRLHLEMMMALVLQRGDLHWSTTAPAVLAAILSLWLVKPTSHTPLHRQQANTGSGDVQGVLYGLLLRAAFQGLAPVAAPPVQAQPSTFTTGTEPGAPNPHTAAAPSLSTPETPTSASEPGTSTAPAGTTAGLTQPPPPTPSTMTLRQSRALLDARDVSTFLYVRKAVVGTTSYVRDLEAREAELQAVIGALRWEVASFRAQADVLAEHLREAEQHALELTTLVEEAEERVEEADGRVETAEAQVRIHVDATTAGLAQVLSIEAATEDKIQQMAASSARIIDEQQAHVGKVLEAVRQELRTARTRIKHDEVVTSSLLAKLVRAETALKDLQAVCTITPPPPTVKAPPQPIA